MHFAASDGTAALVECLRLYVPAKFINLDADLIVEWSRKSALNDFQIEVMNFILIAAAYLRLKTSGPYRGYCFNTCIFHFFLLKRVALGVLVQLHDLRERLPTRLVRYLTN